MRTHANKVGERFGHQPLSDTTPSNDLYGRRKADNNDLPTTLSYPFVTVH